MGVGTQKCILGKPPHNWNAGCEPAPKEPNSEAPERGIYLGRNTRVTEHKVFLEKQVPGGSGSFPFWTHQQLMQRCRTEPVFPRSILLSLAEASPVHWAADVQNNLIAGGGTQHHTQFRKAGIEDNLHNEVTPNYCLSPVPGLFLLSSPETFKCQKNL